MDRKIKRKAYMKYICALLILSTNGIVASYIRQPSYQIVLLRSGIGAVFLLVCFLVTRQRFMCLQYKRDLLFNILSGVALSGYWLFLHEAYVLIGVSIGTLISYIGPVIVIALSPLVFGERIERKKVIGFIIVLVGVFLVNGELSGELNVQGMLCALASAGCYAIMVMTNKKASKIKGLENTLVKLTACFIMVAGFVGMRSGYSMQIGGSDWFWLLVIGIVNTGISCYLYFTAITSLPMQSAAICGYLEPMAAVVFSVLILRESLFWEQWIGALLILGGALGAEYISNVEKEG